MSLTLANMYDATLAKLVNANLTTYRQANLTLDASLKAIDSECEGKILALERQSLTIVGNGEQSCAARHQLKVATIVAKDERYQRVDGAWASYRHTMNAIAAQAWAAMPAMRREALAALRAGKVTRPDHGGYGWILDAVCEGHCRILEQDMFQAMQ